MRAEAGKDAAAVRAEAASELEEARAKAAQAAKDFETTLSRRRDQAEQELSARLAEVERRLAETNESAEQIKREADAHRAESERRAAQILESARGRPRRWSAERDREGDPAAVRGRARAGRRWSAAADSVQAQLQNVREMLATMTGARPVDDPAEDEPATEHEHPGEAGGPEPQARGQRAGDDLVQLGQVVRRRLPLPGGRVRPDLLGRGRAGDDRGHGRLRRPARRSRRRASTARAGPRTPGAPRRTSQGARRARSRLRSPSRLPRAVPASRSYLPVSRPLASGKNGSTPTP